MTSVGEGDLTQKSAREGDDELGKLARGLNQMVTRLRNMATQTRAATENLNSATMEILASARQQSAVTGEQVAAYQETNATMQQVSQSVSSDRRKSQAGHHHRGGRLHRQYFRPGCGPEGQPDRGSDSRASRGGGPEHRVR